MKMFLNDKEINEAELKTALDTIDYGDPDGGDFEIIILSYIDVVGNMYFETAKYSTF